MFTRSPSKQDSSIWAQLALECGFFDQSHLANEFRKLSGLTPTEYQRDIQEDRNLLSGHVAIP